jgi:hypothetical protein
MINKDGILQKTNHMTADEPQAATHEPQGPEEDAPRAEEQEIPSELHVIFTAPGSSQIAKMYSEGAVSTNQIGALGLVLLHSALESWSIPTIQRIVQAVVHETIEEMRKPKIEAAGGPFFNPNMMKGGGGRPV